MRARLTVTARDAKGRFTAARVVAPLLVKARSQVAADIARGFDAGRDPATGRAWPARKHPADHPVLVKTKALRTAAVAAAGRAVVRGSVLVVSVPLPAYAAFHMAGTRWVARRRFLGAGRATVRALAGAMAKAAARLFVNRGVGR